MKSGRQSNGRIFMMTELKMGVQNHEFTELARLARRSDLDLSDVRVFSIPKTSVRNFDEREGSSEPLSTDF